MTSEWVDYYNAVRLHSALGYIAPLDQLEGRAKAIHAARDAKLEAAREQRPINREWIYEQSMEDKLSPSEIFADENRTRYDKTVSSEDRAMLGNNLSADECLESATDFGLKLWETV
jgi:hypothetical protein